METAEKIYKDKIANYEEELLSAYNEITTTRRGVLQIVEQITGKKHFQDRFNGQTSIKTTDAIEFVFKAVTIMQRECHELRHELKKEAAAKEKVSQTDLFRR